MTLPDIIKDLLENGVHFGHLSKHWNPKMKRFIYGKKKNVYIIDLEKTAEKLDEAKEFVRKVAAEGKKVLFVSVKCRAFDDYILTSAKTRVTHAQIKITEHKAAIHSSNYRISFSLNFNNSLIGRYFVDKMVAPRLV